jgi:hypothetical protein
VAVVSPDLRAQALAARQLVAELRAQDEALSEEDALCAVASESDLVEAATATVAAIDQDGEHVAAIEAMIERLKARAERLRRRAQRRRDALLAALELGGLPNLPTPLGTVVAVDGPCSARVTDEDALPDHLFRVTRKPDLRAIAAALKLGPVPGAELSNGARTVALRRK